MAYKWNGAPDLAVVVEPVAPTADTPKDAPAKVPAVFDPSRCGTAPGYKQHRKFGTPPCDRCLAGNAAYSREYAARRKLRQIRRGFNPDRCGDRAGYFHHRRHGVPLCDPCAAANAAYMTDYRAARKAA